MKVAVQAPRPLDARVLTEKLQTQQGQALLDQLVKEIEQVIPEGLLEGHPDKLPDDKFQAAVVDNLFARFTTPSSVRDNTQAAVIAEVLRLAGRDGNVDVENALKSIGPKGVQFLQQLAHIDGKSGDPLADRRTVASLDVHSQKKLAALDPVFPSISSMTALDTMIKQVVKKDELKGFSFVGLQHLFASSGTMFEALHQTGVKHEDMRLIGKVYSTNHRVVADLEHKGAVVSEVSMKVGARTFEDAMADGIESQLKSIIDTLPRPTIFGPDGKQFAEKPKPCVLLIDDGAEAIKILHEKFPDHAPFFVCVEQTRRGARILHELEQKGALKCPVVNVAETWAKLEWESPMIGHSVVLEVDRKLDRLEKAGVAPKKEALVLGCGAVGGGVARAMMRRGMDVHLYDKDPARAYALQQELIAEAQKEGRDASKIFVHLDKKDALAHGGVLVSCVGARTLEQADHAHLPNGAVLVNAASADDELGPQDLLMFQKHDVMQFDERGNMWSTFQGQPVNTGKGDAEAHSDAVVVTKEGKEFYVVNNGYVVNMTGERDPIPPRYIQLTRTLLFLGAITAKRASEGTDGGVGVHDVPKEWQQALVNLVQRELKKSGEDLKKPSWETKKQDKWAEEEALAPPADVVKHAARERETGLDMSRVNEISAAVAGTLPRISAEDVLAVKPGEAWSKENKLYGYAIGEAPRGSYERQVAELVDGESKLSLEGAALHKACVFLNKTLGVSLRASLKPPGGQAPLFADKSKVQHHEGKVIVEGGGPQSGRERFEDVYGHFCRILTSSILANRLQRAPTATELAAELKKLMPQQKVDVTSWLNTLARSTDADDQALLAALRA